MELNEKEKASLWTKLAEVLGISKEAKVEVKLTDYKAQDGTTISVNDDTQEVSGVEDGSYELEDGSTMVVKDGKVESITAPEPEAETKEEEVKEDSPEVADLKNQIADLQKQLEELTKEKETALSEKTALATELSEIKDKPADKKVNLNANQNTTLSAAQKAWQIYQTNSKK